VQINEKLYVEFEVLTPVVMKSTLFWDITPCSPLKVGFHLQGRHILSHFLLARLILSTLNMEAICSSETSVDSQRTTRRYIPEDDTLQETLVGVLLCLCNVKINFFCFMHKQNKFLLCLSCD
jgi:hypothetical protein